MQIRDKAGLLRGLRLVAMLVSQTLCKVGNPLLSGAGFFMGDSFLRSDLAKDSVVTELFFRRNNEHNRFDVWK